MGLTNPQLEFDVKTARFVLAAPYKTPELTVQKGFTSDGVSSPRLARPLVSKAGKALPAALIHDWCYQNAWNSRAEADRLFWHNLKRCGVHPALSALMYVAVRIFGKGNYK